LVTIKRKKYRVRRKNFKVGFIESNMEKVGAFGLFRGLNDDYKNKWLFIEEESKKKDFWIGIYSLYNLIRYAITKDLISIEDVNVFLKASSWGGKFPVESKEDILINI
jgi:hypothetical protein